MADLAVTAPTTGKPGTAPRPALRHRAGAASWGRRTIAVVYIGLLVAVPIGVIAYKTFAPGFGQFADQLTSEITVHAFKISAIVAGSAVVINTVFGIAVAVLLARYRFPGKRLLSAFVDLPVAVSPIVVGLALILVYSSTGWFGSLLGSLDYQVINAKPGMVLATVFVSLPLVVRAVEPVLQQAGTEQEQAAESLGAGPVSRFVRITLPTIRVALLYGVVLSIARCLGEYGAVLVVSGNVEGQTETAPLRVGNLIDNEQNFDGAYSIAFTLMITAFVAILIGAFLRRRGASR